MRRYEQIYILRPNLSEDEITKVVENTNKIITDEAGSIISTVKWGMKKLAYPIKKELQGYYVFCDFATTPAAVSEVERKFRIDDSVLKYLSIKLADSITDEEIQAAQEDAAVAVQKELESDEAEKTDEPVEAAKKATDEPVEAAEKAPDDSSSEADEPKE